MPAYQPVDRRSVASGRVASADPLQQDSRMHSALWQVLAASAGRLTYCPPPSCGILSPR
ncbi:hypothetical protein JKG47_22590 [Acidithiobacillus sp. MC6.1]|nr:hypothetical protein [Acidithiobacillus sp. MC6.1]